MIHDGRVDTWTPKRLCGHPPARVSCGKKRGLLSWDGTSGSVHGTFTLTCSYAMYSFVPLFSTPLIET